MFLVPTAYIGEKYSECKTYPAAVLYVSTAYIGEKYSEFTREQSALCTYQPPTLAKSIQRDFCKEAFFKCCINRLHWRKVFRGMLQQNHCSEVSTAYIGEKYSENMGFLNSKNEQYQPPTLAKSIQSVVSKSMLKLGINRLHWRKVFRDLTITNGQVSVLYQPPTLAKSIQRLKLPYDIVYKAVSTAYIGEKYSELQRGQGWTETESINRLHWRKVFRVTP